MSHIGIPRVVAALAILSAILVPTASAKPFDDPDTGVAIDAPAQTAGGFDWGDAAIGAGGMMMLLSAGGAGIVTIRRGRGRSHTLATS